SHLLTNPIFYGHFRYNGEVYEGKHEALITKKLFDDVQAVIDKRWRYSPKEKKVATKAFLGLLHCADCGGGITAGIQKVHTYYRCTKNKRFRLCSQPYMREEALENEISALIKPFALRADWADEMLERVKKEKQQSAQSAAQLAELKRQEIEKI